MKPKKSIFISGSLFLALSFLCWFLLGKSDKTPPWAKDPPSDADHLVAKFSPDVLPGSAKILKARLHPNDPPAFLAHDTPALDRRAKGAYSYLGAAREFRNLCGIDLPDWLTPKKGGYHVSRSGKSFRCSSTLQFKIDPQRRDELKQLLSQAWKNK